MRQVLCSAAPLLAVALLVGCGSGGSGTGLPTSPSGGAATLGGGSAPPPPPGMVVTSESRVLLPSDGAADPAAIERAAARLAEIGREVHAASQQIVDRESFDRIMPQLRSYNAEIDQLADTLYANGITFTLRGIPDNYFAEIEAIGHQEGAEMQRIAALPDGESLFKEIAAGLGTHGYHGVGRVKVRLINK